MKVSQVKTLAAACIINTCLFTAMAEQPKWTDPEAWRLQLQKYMTATEVQAVLGDPIDREVSNIAMIWYYHQSPTRIDGKVTQRPKIGTVKFNLIKIHPVANRRLPQPVYAVIDFTEPDWDNIPDFPDDPPQAEEIEQTELPEPPKKVIQPPKPVITKPQKPAIRFGKEAIEYRKEQEKQKQLEELEGCRKRKEARAKALAEKQANKPAPPPAKPKGFVSKYFLILGGIFFVTGIGLIFLKKNML